jgi:sulfur carrier protein ThiS
MPTVSFTTNIQRHVDCPAMRVEGATLRAALEAYFAAHPQAKAYVLDEQGIVRHHVAVFVDGEMLRDRRTLDVPLSRDSEVFVMQALSGG